MKKTILSFMFLFPALIICAQEATPKVDKKTTPSTTLQTAAPVKAPKSERISKKQVSSATPLISIRQDQQTGKSEQRLSPVRKMK